MGRILDTKVANIEGEIPNYMFAPTFEYARPSGKLTSTVAAINTASTYGIQVAQLGTTFPRAKNCFIRGVWVSADIPCEVHLYINGLNIHTQLFISANTPVYIPVNVLWTPFKLTQNPSPMVYVRSTTSAATGNVNINGSFDVMYVPSDTRPANKIIRWIGDSITFGVGASLGSDLVASKVTNELRLRGKSYKFETCGISGSTTSTQKEVFDSGIYEYDIKNIGCIVICLGTNDCTTAISAATYKANMKRYASMFLNNPENSNLVVVMMSAPPITNNTYETLRLTHVTALNEIATELNNSRLFVVDLTGSFDRTSSTYLPDGAHPAPIATQAMFDNAWIPFLNSAQGTLFLSKL